MQVFSLDLEKFIVLEHLMNNFCVTVGRDDILMLPKRIIPAWAGYSLTQYSLLVYLYLEKSMTGTKVAAAYHCSHPYGSCIS